MFIDIDIKNYLFIQFILLIYKEYYYLKIKIYSN